MFSRRLINQPISWSAPKKNSAARMAITKTMIVEIVVSRRVGHVTFDVSARTCWRNVNGFDFDAIECPRNYGA